MKDGIYGNYTKKDGKWFNNKGFTFDPKVKTLNCAKELKLEESCILAMNDSDLDFVWGCI